MISLETITKQLESTDILKQLGQSVGANPDQVQKAAKLGLPTLLEALNRNSNDASGAESLTKALDQHKGLDMNNISGFLSNVNSEDGSKILEHIFGDKNSQVQNNLAKGTGMDKGQIGGLMMQFAPLILSFLGNQKEEQHLDSNGVSGLTSVLSGLMASGQKENNLLSVATSMLDLDGNDDDGGGLLGNILGKLF